MIRLCPRCTKQNKSDEFDCAGCGKDLSDVTPTESNANTTAEAAPVITPAASAATAAEAEVPVAMPPASVPPMPIPHAPPMPGAAVQTRVISLKPTFANGVELLNNNKETLDPNAQLDIPNNSEVRIADVSANGEVDLRIQGDEFVSATHIIISTENGVGSITGGSDGAGFYILRHYSSKDKVDLQVGDTFIPGSLGCRARFKVR